MRKFPHFFNGFLQQDATINMEKKKGNIHDHNFKHNFTSKSVAHDFLKHNLPKKVLDRVDIDTVEIENNEFIPSRYRSKRRADILYSVKDKHGRKVYALLHLEGQSRHDEHMAIRVLEYHVAIVRAHLRKGYEKVPFILTFVLYHGKRKWTSPKSIAELFVDFDLYVDVSLKASFLCNLTKTQFEKLKKQGAAAAPQLIMKGQSIGDYCEMLDELWPLMKKYGQVDEENIDYMTAVDKHGGSQFLEKFSKFDAETANDYKIMFEAAIQKEHKKALKLGIIKGKKEGKQEGKEERNKEIAKQMLAKQIDQALISEVTGLSLNEINKLSTKSARL